MWMPADDRHCPGCVRGGALKLPTASHSITLACDIRLCSSLEVKIMAAIQQVFQISLGMARGGSMHLAKPRQRCVLPALLQFRPLHNGTAQLHLNAMMVLHLHLSANVTVLSLSFH